MSEWTILLHDKVIKRFRIEDGQKLTIGRGTEADVVVDNTAVSRKHTCLEYNNGIYFISDCGSLNGTFVNGQKVDTPIPISANDTVEIGKFLLTIATEGTQETSDSYATPMDIEDETVFISAQKIDSIKAENNTTRGKHMLSVIEGEANPTQLVLDGKSSIKVGTETTCDIILTGWLVAKAQFYIIKRDDKYFIVPQRSWASTLLNGIKITDESQLRKGDVIEVRSIKMRYE